MKFLFQLYSMTGSVLETSRKSMEVVADVTTCLGSGLNALGKVPKELNNIAKGAYNELAAVSTSITGC